MQSQPSSHWSTSGALASAVKDARYNPRQLPRLCAVRCPREANLNISEGAYAHIGQQVFTLIDAARTCGGPSVTLPRKPAQHIVPGMRADVYIAIQAECAICRRSGQRGIWRYARSGCNWQVGAGASRSIQRTLNWVRLASRYPVHCPSAESFARIV